MAKMLKMSGMMTVFVCIGLLFLAGWILSFVIEPVREFFGAQGGEMVQLATSHVPTEEDAQMWEEEKKQIKKDLIDMTGSY